MKLEITTTGKKVEIANCVLGQAIVALKENKAAREALSLSEKDLDLAEEFRLEILSRYLNKPKKDIGRQLK